MAAALVAVHGTGLAVALALLWWRDHATVWRPWDSARRPVVRAQRAGGAA
jgi:hypothetical protein